MAVFTLLRARVEMPALIRCFARSLGSGRIKLAQIRQLLGQLGF